MLEKMIQSAIGDCIAYRVPRIATLMRVIPVPELGEVIGSYIWEFYPLYWFQEELVDMDRIPLFRRLLPQIESSQHPLMASFRQCVAEWCHEICYDLRDRNYSDAPTNMREYLIYIRD